MTLPAEEFEPGEEIDFYPVADIERLTRQRDELLAVLRFYADKTRYEGPNQRQREPDMWSEKVSLSAYRLDVTRDGGQIAREAIAKVEADK